MTQLINEKKLIEIFISCDDFDKMYEKMSVFDIDHTRHRSHTNAIAHTFSALAAYCFYENKPAVFIAC